MKYATREEKVEALLRRDEKARESAERRRIHDTLMVRKAKLAKIEVSEQEIDDYIKNEKKSRG